MHKPYVKLNSTSASVNITGEVVNKNACLYQSSVDSCRFSLGADGVQQMEFDYQIEGKTGDSWF